MNVSGTSDIAVRRRPRLDGRFARSYYRFLLLSYPREFRRRDGAEAAWLFADACHDSRVEGGIFSVVRRLVHALAVVPRQGLTERLRRAPESNLHRVGGGRGRKPRGGIGREPRGGIGREPRGGNGQEPRGGSGREPRGRSPRGRWSRRAAIFLSGVAADLRFAARSLRRRPAWTATIAATLALGIGANTAIFSVMDATLLQTSPWPDADRMATVDAHATEADLSVGATLADLRRWFAETEAFERLEAYESRPVVLSHEAGARRVTVRKVTAGYLGKLGIDPVIGRFPSADDTRSDAPVVTAMPENLWRRLYGGDPGVVGATVQLDGVTHEVIGVVPDARGVPDAFFKSLRVDEENDLLVRGYVWLRDGVSFEEARSRLEAVSVGEHDRLGPYVGTLTQRGNIFWELDEFRGGLLALMGAVFLVLTIACVNVANLLLAAARTRRGELAVRAALGAGRARLVRFLLAESLMLSGIGAALGVFVAYGCMRTMLWMAPGGQLGDALERVRLDGTVLGYATLIAAIAGLGFGLLPALQAAGTGQRAALQSSDPRAGGGRRRMRGAVVALETALSLVLLVAAGLTLRSFVDLRFADQGFDSDRIMSVYVALPEARYTDNAGKEAFFDTLRAQTALIPGIEAVMLGAGAVPPSDIATGGAMTIEGRSEPVQALATLSMVECGFLEFMGVPLIAGRDLEEDDIRNVATSDAVPVVINQALARRFWPDGDALGARFRMSLSRDDRWRHVVGIAADVRQQGLEAPEDMLHIYAPYEFDPRVAQLVLRTHAGVAPPIQEVRSLIHRLDPQIPTDALEAAATGMLDSLSNTRFRAALFGAFGLVAVLLAAVGIFGVVAYTVVQRTPEMGVRLALGAAPRDVLRMMLWDGGAAVVAGIGAGLLVAFCVTRLMAGFLHGISPSDPLTFVATAVMLLAIGLAATWVPARRATKVDPVMTLRRG